MATTSGPWTIKKMPNDDGWEVAYSHNKYQSTALRVPADELLNLCDLIAHCEVEIIPSCEGGTKVTGFEMKEVPDA